ncbi:hypothetical protein HI914_04161 [Erysiphe necator]|nr:hypothetical protein HI914_04161 [Erysiphe necator]
MGLIFKALFSISTTGRGSKKTQGYSYDASVPSSPPIKGRHPILGNGPKSMSIKPIRPAKAQRHVERQITTSASSTTVSSTTYIPDTPRVFCKIESQSTVSTSPTNLRLEHGRRSWEKDTRWSRPTTSTSFIPSTPQRPKTGNSPVSLPKKLRHLDSLPKDFNFIPRTHHVDLLDAHSLIHSSEKMTRYREKASGTRSYGEDVADRNKQPQILESPIERLDTPQEPRPLIDSPELKFLKEIHLANKRAVGMTDDESIRALSPPPQKVGNEKFLKNNLPIKLSHPHSHPIRSLLNISNEVHQSVGINAKPDRARSQSLSKPLPNTPSKDDAMLKVGASLFKTPGNPVSSAARDCTPPKISKGYSTSVPKEIPDIRKGYQKSRRHTFSSEVSRRISPSPGQGSLKFQQNSQLIPCSNSLTTKTSNLGPKEIHSSKLTDELTESNTSLEVADSIERANEKTNEKIQPACSQKENLGADEISEKNDVNTVEPKHKKVGQRRYSLKQDFMKYPSKLHMKSRSRKNSELKVEDVLPPNQLFDLGGLCPELSLPNSRHSTLRESSCYLPAEAPTIHFNRNRSLDQADEDSLQDIQIMSDPVDNDSSNSLIVVTTREKGTAYKRSHNSSLKAFSLSKNMSNEILNPILPNKKDYMKNEALLGTKYIWHLRPLSENNFSPKSLHSEVRKAEAQKVSISEYKYYKNGRDDFSIPEQEFSGSEEENLNCREESCGFDFASMLPGLQMMESAPMALSTVGQKI